MTHEIFSNNTTIFSNNTTTPTTLRAVNEIKMPAVLKGILYLAYVLIFFIGGIGNIFVIHRTGFQLRTNKKAYLFQVVSLAIADLLGSIFIPLNMIHDIAVDNKTWKLFGPTGCKIFASMNPFLTTVSAWMMVAIAITRYRIIQRAENIRLNRGINCNVFVSLQACILGIIITIPYTYHLDVKENVCWDRWNSLPGHLIYVSVFVVSWSFLPICILVILSVNSYKRLKSLELKQKISKRSGKIAKTFALIIVSFFLLTTPYAVFYLVWAYVYYFMAEWYVKWMEMFNYLNYFFFSVSSLNTAINPIIYNRAEISNFLCQILFPFKRRTRCGKESDDSCRTSRPMTHYTDIASEIR